MENNIAPQIMRDCRMLRIGEGANELMTLSVGRRVYHSEKLDEFLRVRLGCPELSDRLKDVSQRIQHRCLSPSAPFVDRSTALSWAFNLIGRVTIKGVVMAAAQDTARRTPSALLNRAVAWASLEFERALDEALRGTTAESFLLGSEAITTVIAGYSEAIGDIEQVPPGVEESIDPLLRRQPDGEGFPKLTHLPGNVNPAGLIHKSPPAAERKAITSEQKRRLAAQLLRRQHAARVESSAPGMGQATQESLSESSLP